LNTAVTYSVNDCCYITMVGMFDSSTLYFSKRYVRKYRPVVLGIVFIYPLWSWGQRSRRERNAEGM